MPPHSDDRKPSSDDAPTSEGIRLQRYLAATGLGSRRKCEEYIVAGRVNVDGQVARDLGTRVDPERQQVRVDGELVRRDPPRYFLLNKPRGYLCTNSDPAGRPRAVDLLPPSKLRLFTVGRLDESSEGLILLTNDGDLAHRLAHPRFQVERTYALQVAGRPTPETFATLKDGLYFQEGRFSIRWVKRAGTKGNSTFLEVGLSHGQNREIRRLFARVGHKVMRLRRIAFGPLSLGKLAEGRFRPLTSVEMTELRDLASSKRPRVRDKSPDRGARARRPHAARDRSLDVSSGERPRVGKQGSVSKQRSVGKQGAAGKQSSVGKHGSQRRSDRSGKSEASASAQAESFHGSKRRTRNRPGTSRHTGGRQDRAADTRSLGQGSGGPRKRRPKHA